MDLNRRDFVAATAVTICGCLAGCAGGTGGRGDTATATHLPPEAGPNGTVDVGTAADYPGDAVYDRYAKAERVYVVRRGGRLYALRSICTHKTCLVEPVGSNFHCPCHGSRFELDGTVTKGPATRDLPRYAIAKSADGRLTVDKSRRFGPDANDPATYVSV